MPALIVPYPNVLGFPGFTKYKIGLLKKSIELRSQFDGKRQVLNFPYNVWEFKGDFSIFDNLCGNAMKSFLAQLDGKANAFRLMVPECSGPQSGYVGNTGLVNGASQSGTSLVTDGWSNNSWILKDGDYFTVNDELKVVVGDVSSDGSGNATITFKPALRKSPADNLQLFIGNEINQFIWSQDFTNAIWIKTLSSTIGTGIADPNGGTNANTLISNAANNPAFRQTVPGIDMRGRTATFSVWLKQGTFLGNITLDIRDGSVTNPAVSSAVTPTGSWVRYSVTGTFPTTGQLTSGITGRAQFASNAGAGGQTVQMFGAQIELDKSVASTYKFTTTGDGNPTVLLNNSNDDAMSWDVSPPILYNVSLDCMECIE